MCRCIAVAVGDWRQGLESLALRSHAVRSREEEQERGSKKRRNNSISCLIWMINVLGFIAKS